MKQLFDDWLQFAYQQIVSKILEIRRKCQIESFFLSRLKVEFYFEYRKFQAMLHVQTMTTNPITQHKQTFLIKFDANFAKWAKKN